MRRIFIIFLLVILIFSLFIYGIFKGGSAKSITIQDVKNFLFYGSTGDKFKDILIWEVRIPPLVTAVIVGMVLSVSGLKLQTLFRNLLASPYTTGISSGAILGVAITIFLGFSFSNFLNIPDHVIGGWIGASLALIVLLFLASRIRDVSGVLVCTILFTYFYYGVESYLITFADNIEIQEFWMYLQGNFTGVRWENLKLILTCSIIFLIISYLLSKHLNALLFGENYAKSFGLNIKKVRLLILFLSSFIVGTIIPFVGLIPFIGIASPYIARIIMKTSDHRWTIPASMLVGMFISLLCYLISIKLFAPKVIPVKSILDLFGGLLVVYLIYKSEKHLKIDL
ncbi:transport system permease protein [Methanocaldococcus infernus ME]|uniref:Transport system permease protein n=1 Tax=Methanocaldococcus infernus (strain DSM 11812 / JCM 15783 / ME) TaxID=573063 RepID=D5VU10_METIM|nr:iron ABC transporter permease [Methanocaldococcus infernus]ADG14063.1 transport system permease protein [Methanocaldococcus infernus ME]